MLIANCIYLGKALALALDQIQLSAEQAQRDQYLFFFGELLRSQGRLSNLNIRMFVRGD